MDDYGAKMLAACHSRIGHSKTELNRVFLHMTTLGRLVPIAPRFRGGLLCKAKKVVWKINKPSQMLHFCGYASFGLNIARVTQNFLALVPLA